MNPSDKKEEEKEADSTAENKPESSSSDQETEKTSNKPESSSSDQETEKPSSQSGEATSSSKPSSKTPSLATLQKIAASFGDVKVPEFLTKQIQSLSNTRKSKPGLPPLSPKKPKLTHPNPNPKPKPKPNPNPNPNPDPNPDPDPDEPDPNDPMLFDIFVTNSERLPIAYDPAMYHFPAIAMSSSALSEQVLQFTDPTGQLWPDIAYVCFDSEEAFILTRNWAQYAQAFNLGVMDTVRFFRPNPRLGPNHFQLQHLPRPIEPVTIRFPEFLPQNFLFQVELAKGDVAFGRLVIVADLVRQHFPGVRSDQKQEMVKLTDFRDKDWYVTMVYSGYGDRYMVMDGWEGFVKEHELDDGDFVRFYNPDLLAHDKHFLIQFERQARAKA